MDQLKAAVALARIVHANAKDNAGRNLFSHLEQVANRAPDYASPYGKRIRTTAYLSWMLSSKIANRDQLLSLGFANSIILSVVRLCCHYDRWNEQSIESLIESKDRIAVAVQLADFDIYLEGPSKWQFTNLELDRIKKYRAMIAVAGIGDRTNGAEE